MKRRRSYVLVAAGVVALAISISLAPSMVEHGAYAAARGTNEADRELLIKLSEKEQLSALFRTVAKTVKPAVVVIRVKKRVMLPEMRFDSDEFMRRFFGENNGPGLRWRTPRLRCLSSSRSSTGCRTRRAGPSRRRWRRRPSTRGSP